MLYVDQIRPTVAGISDERHGFPVYFSNIGLKTWITERMLAFLDYPDNKSLLFVVW